MAQLIWTESALVELESIAEFIGRGSAISAKRMVELAYEAAKRIAEHPMSGRQIPEINNARHREVFVGAYSLMYRIDEQKLHITAAIHGARKFNPAGN